MKTETPIDFSQVDWLKAEPEPKIKKQFLTGSSLVRGVTPKDKDVVCLFDNWDDVWAFVKTKNINSKKTVSLEGEMRFLSCYGDDHRTNYICTADVELFYRFKAFSGALSLLQLKDRDDRVKLAAACLYWGQNDAASND